MWGTMNRAQSRIKRYPLFNILAPEFYLFTRYAFILATGRPTD